jgi:hypothetical protein
MDEKFPAIVFCAVVLKTTRVSKGNRIKKIFFNFNIC